jgi:HlyD family secretion protein
MKRLAVAVLAMAAVGGGAYWYFKYNRQPEAPTVTTAAVTRGDVVETVGATGTLQAVTTVQVGTQVSGTIQSLYADFNSLVKKGQVLARLDPSLFRLRLSRPVRTSFAPRPISNGSGFRWRMRRPSSPAPASSPPGS